MKIKQYDFYYELRSLPFVDAIWLYGSRAQEDNRNLSDIDLAILCPTASSIDWLKVPKIISCADTLFQIDFVRFDTLQDRNQASHTYKRKIASEIYYRIKNYYPAMQKAYLVIKEKYKI